MDQLKIGHYTDLERATGLSVFLFNEPAVGVYYLCGSAPASRELAVLAPEAHVTHCNALVFSGGSAFGLGAADGVMQFLREQGRGWPTLHGIVPIVPVAAIYDWGRGSVSWPVAENAYQACLVANTSTRESGQRGAGCGASVGKLIANATLMAGGLGIAEYTFAAGIQMLACAVVNSVGDVRGREGHIIAGAKYPDGSFADCAKAVLEQQALHLLGQNTTLVALFINAKFSKGSLLQIAKMASAGFAQAITPSFTVYDGDIVFCFSLGEEVIDECTAGTAAAMLTRQAIINAVSVGHS